MNQMLAKRISLSLLAIGAVSVVVSAASFALFSAQTSNQQNTFSSGTVAFGAPSHNIVNVSNIAPGDKATYNYSVQYTGSLDAWLGIDASFTGDLLSCDAANSLQAAISDGRKTFTSSTSATQVLGTAPVSTGHTVNLTVDWELPLAAGNSCQGKSAAIAFTVKAVQSRNNTNATNDGPVSWN
jgi:spore coat-associated protein N